MLDSTLVLKLIPLCVLMDIKMSLVFEQLMGFSCSQATVIPNPGEYQGSAYDLLLEL